MTKDFNVGGLAAQAFDIEADGIYLYIGVRKSDELTPRILKLHASLGNDATEDYNPGTGTEVNIKAGDRTPGWVWAAGDFGTAKVVKLDNEAGIYWTSDAESDTWYGPVHPIRVDPADDRIVLVHSYGNDNTIFEAYFTGLNAESYWMPAGVAPGDVYAMDVLDYDPGQVLVGLSTRDWGSPGYWYPVHYTPNRALTFSNVSVPAITDSQVACTSVIVG